MQLSPFHVDERVHALSVTKTAVDKHTPQALARLAVKALVEEAELTPKPALVDQRGSGAHHDLSLELLLRSASELESHFVRMAEVAWNRQTDRCLREQLGLLGRDAEAAMLAVTGGVNTHKGAIWALGLLVSAASQGPELHEKDICDNASAIALLADTRAHSPSSNGDRAASRYGAGGARSEAERGFPHVVFVGLPALRRSREAGLAEEHARLNALLSIMASLEDTCLLHRGGHKALNAAQQGAHDVLACGGSSTRDGIAALDRLHASLVDLWASPGGSADMLAATLFLDSLTSSQEHKA